jgi:hypothetical protein
MQNLKNYIPALRYGAKLPIDSLQGAGILTFGNIYFVNSVTGSDTANTGTEPNQPFATIDRAMTSVTANNGDVVFVMPKHAETITGVAGSSLTLDVAGVRVIGLGTGNARPTITLATPTTTTITMSAANCSIENVILTSSIAELASMITLSAAGCTLDNVDVQGGSTSIIKFITTTAAGDQLTISNCQHMTTAAVTAAGPWINLVGADDCKIINNYLNITTKNDATSNIIGGGTTASLRVIVKNNEIYNLGTSCVPISMYTGSTGLISYNNIGGSKTTAAGMVVPASCYANNNFVTNVTSTSGKLDPVATA